MNKYEKIEFWLMAFWSLVMIPLGVYSVIKGHDVPMGLATCYSAALGSYAIKITWQRKGENNDSSNGNPQ